MPIESILYQLQAILSQDGLSILVWEGYKVVFRLAPYHFIFLSSNYSVYGAKYIVSFSCFIIGYHIGPRAGCVAVLMLCRSSNVQNGFQYERYYFIMKKLLS